MHMFININRYAIDFPNFKIKSSTVFMYAEMAFLKFVPFYFLLTSCFLCFPSVQS